MTDTTVLASPEESTVLHQSGWIDKLGYFSLAVLGFSFWFFIGVPFAAHRESYAWLAAVRTHRFLDAFSFISVTYRPLAQGITWFGYMLLDPKEFPTSAGRQALLQGLVYILFLSAWWLIFLAAKQMRSFSILALVVGAVYFPGYVHLFHIYGLFYAPVMLMLGTVLLFDSLGAPKSSESWIGVSAILLVLWHPFATAIFLGYYFGHYLATCRSRTKGEHVKAGLLLGGASAAIYLTVVVFVRSDVKTPLATKLYGGLVTYQTNEVNALASVISLILTLAVILGLHSSSRIKMVLLACLLVGGAGLMIMHMPFLLLWIGMALVKLALMRRWGLFCAALAAALLPIGAVIGTPVFGLFAIILATYATCLEWRKTEFFLSVIDKKWAFVAVVLSAVLAILIRAGFPVPGLTRAASPLLQERERTYQLEQILVWLHKSQYCSYGVDFADKSGSPIDSVANVISRKFRPPAGIEDVQTFWNEILRCGGRSGGNTQANTAIVTFRGPQLEGYQPVFTIKGRYAGDASVWINATDASIQPDNERFTSRKTY